MGPKCVGLNPGGRGSYVNELGQAACSLRFSFFISKIVVKTSARVNVCLVGGRDEISECTSKLSISILHVVWK